VKEENMDKKRELNIEGVAKFVKKVWKTEDHVPMENEQKEAVREVIEQRPHRINTILKGSKLVGNITVAQDLEFSGDVEGNITAEQKSNVVIRGNCKGNITAREGNIELEGDVSNGDIIAGGSVRITGNFRGRKIEAKEKIYINGEFAGTLESSEIELGPNARGKGELIYRDYVSIHRGAHIEAQIHRVGKELGEERKISNTRVIDFESPSQKKSEAK
jgi:cytoskeletal protein CcmA (bactofilin family)